MGGPLELRLGCEGVECAASAAVGRARLGLGSAAEEDEDDAALVDGCAAGGGLGLAAGFMAEDFFWLGYRPGLDWICGRAEIGEERGGQGLRRDVLSFFVFPFLFVLR